MKKLVFIAIALIGLQALAQQEKKERPNRERAEEMMNLSAEELATLQTKKMTLHLDLNESQQAEIHKINLENATQRKAMMEARKAKKASGELTKPNQEERLAMKNAMLDHKIAMKAKMKKVLNEEQYAKWEKSQMRKDMKGQEKKEVMKKRMLEKHKQ